jgi:hypothetical protein
MRPEITAVTVASAARRSRRTNRVSEMLPRLRATVAGESTSTAAAAMPARAPDSRRTAWYRMRTLAIPSTIWGATMAHAWSPNTRTDRACTQNAPGSLSTVTVPAGSNAAKKKLCQLIDMRTAAA